MTQSLALLIFDERLKMALEEGRWFPEQHRLWCWDISLSESKKILNSALTFIKIPL